MSIKKICKVILDTVSFQNPVRQFLGALRKLKELEEDKQNEHNDKKTGQK